MTLKEIIYSVFYLIAFGLAIATGISLGFTGSHTPPMPFLIELLALFLGLIIFFIDLSKKGPPKTFVNFKVHIIGLALNGLVMAYILILTL
jgi:hypothetical protein